MSSSLTEFLAQLPAARRAIDYGDRAITIGELVQDAERAATGLRALDINAGDRVALWLPNIPAWLVLFFACARIGAIAVAVNTRFRAHEVQDIVGRSGCRLLVLWPGFKDIDFSSILRAVDPAALSELREVVTYDEGTPGAFELGGRRITRYAAVLDRSPDPAPAAPPTARCVIFTTSGTTKAPKFVCHRQAGVVHHARDVAGAFGFDAPDSRILQALPLCGVFGFTQALAALAGSAVLRMLPVFDAARAVDLLSHDRITHMNGSDEMMDRMLATTDVARPFPQLRWFGFARFNPALEDIVARADARGVIMRGLYGMSEVHALFAVQPVAAPVAARAKGGGRLVSPLAEVRVRDPATGALLTIGEQGELEVRGPSLMAEYFGDPAATREAMTEDGFFRTGDLGYIEPDGRFCYVTRMGDVLRLSGYLTSPQEIEAELEAHPDIEGSQVVGCVLKGQPVAIAFVILRSGGILDEPGIRAWCRERLASYKVPLRVFALQEFPTVPSANGTKIQRAKLRELAEQLAGS